MAQFYVTYTGELGLNAGENLLETMREVEKEDELIISMYSQNAHQADQIFHILDENKFEYLPKGDETGHRYYIYAKRK